MIQIRLDDIFLGPEVTTGAWVVPQSFGDCPNEDWPLAKDVIILDC